MGREVFGVPPVDPHALAGEHLVVDRLLGQRVPEGVSVALGEDEVGRDRLPDGLVDDAVVSARHRGEDGVLGVHAAGGHDPRDLLRGVTEPRVAREDELAERVGQLRAAEVDEFLDQERDPAAAFDQSGQCRVVQVRGERRHLLGHLVRGQGPQLDADDRARAVQFGEDGTQGVESVDVVRSVGRHDREVAAPQGTGECLQEGERRRVRPLEVLDHDHEVPRHREVLENRFYRLGEVAGRHRRCRHLGLDARHERREGGRGRG